MHRNVALTICLCRINSVVEKIILTHSGAYNLKWLKRSNKGPDQGKIMLALMKKKNERKEKKSTYDLTKDHTRKKNVRRKYVCLFSLTRFLLRTPCVCLGRSIHKKNDVRLLIFFSFSLKIAYKPRHVREYVQMRQQTTTNNEMKKNIIRMKWAYNKCANKIDIYDEIKRNESL